MKTLSRYNKLILGAASDAEPFMRATAFIAVFTQPLFFVIWCYVFPQPYENLTIRLLAGLICLPIVFKSYWPQSLQHLSPYYWQLAVFSNLPFLFAFFLLENHYSQVWALSMLVSALLLTFLIDWLSAILQFVAGAVVAWMVHSLIREDIASFSKYLEILSICFFGLFVGGAVNFRLQQYRANQREFEKKMHLISIKNRNMIRQYNKILSRFLSNVLVQRLVKLQDQYGLDNAIERITAQERRFCAIMQADVRNFTKMFGSESEHDVARLISMCFSEVTEFGQNLAVIKPVGDCIFLYSDDENGRERAVLNILALAFLLVNTVENINSALKLSNTPLLNFGIALHAGEVTYGNIASETMIDPTIIGINVNMTARLEELTKTPSVKDIVGSNGIILSEEFKTLSQQHFENFQPICINLEQLGATVRDFPSVSTVYAVPRAIALSHQHFVHLHVHDRQKRALVSYATDKNEYLGVNYNYDMQGVGAELTWRMQINIAGFSGETVQQYASRNLADFNVTISSGLEPSIEMDTERFPGEYDEVEIEERIIKIIEELSSYDPPR
ncbi:MAG: adenylate/guanylate cyclase domain-containing protein [bacterium]